MDTAIQCTSHMPDRCGRKAAVRDTWFDRIGLLVSILAGAGVIAGVVALVCFAHPTWFRQEIETAAIAQTNVAEKARSFGIVELRRDSSANRRGLPDCLSAKFTDGSTVTAFCTSSFEGQLEHVVVVTPSDIEYRGESHSQGATVKHFQDYISSELDQFESIVREREKRARANATWDQIEK